MVVVSQASPAGHTPRNDATQGLAPDLVRGALALTPAALSLPKNLHHSIMCRGVERRSLWRIEAWMHNLSLPSVTLSTKVRPLHKTTDSRYPRKSTLKWGAPDLGGALAA